eukprot:2202478-Amphidinium_carterae.1
MIGKSVFPSTTAHGLRRWRGFINAISSARIGSMWPRSRRSHVYRLDTLSMTKIVSSYVEEAMSKL